MREILPQSPQPSSPPKEEKATLSSLIEKEKPMKKLIPKRKKECSGKHSLTLLRWLESFIKKGMRDWKEDLNFKRKDKDLWEVNMMNTSQRREMEEMEEMESHYLHPNIHHHNHPLLILQYINHTSPRALVKILF